MNKCTLIVQILSCKSVKVSDNNNQTIKLKARFSKRKKVAFINLIIWDKHSLEFFKIIKKLDYVLVEGKLHRDDKILKNNIKKVQKDLVFSVSRILKYKDVDLFIK